MKLLQRLGERLGSSTRVIVTILGLVAAAFAISGIIAVRTLEHELVARVDTRVLDDARAATRALAVLGTDELIAAAESSQTGSPTTALMLFDSDGDVVYSRPSGPSRSPDPLPRVPDATELPRRAGIPFTTGAVDDDMDYRAVTATAGDLTVLVASPLEGVYDTVHTLARTLIAIGIAALAVLAALIWAVITAANRQFEHMIDTATRIGDGDLSARIDDFPTATSAGQLGHALNEMLHQLEAAFVAREHSEERLRRFAADASHELRTPLTHIRGYAEMLRSGAVAAPDERAAALARIESEGARMTAILDDLLLLARIDRGRAPRRDRVELIALLTDSVADARAVDSDAPFAVTLPDHEVVVLGDEDQIRQVFANLLTNVRTHTPAGTTASVTMTNDAEAVTITVADDGPGMTADAASRVFDRFSRPEESRSRATGGSGLGLAITAAIVHAHGGTITLDTAPGAGARFTITLPVPAVAPSPYTGER